MYLEVKPYNERKSKLVHISIEHKQKIELLYERKQYLNIHIFTINQWNLYLFHWPNET